MPRRRRSAPDRDREFEEAHDRWAFFDNTYAAESLEWTVPIERAGIYQRIARLIAPSPGHVHLDVGTGLGRLPAALKEACPNLGVIALDHNVDVMRLANHHLAHERGLEIEAKGSVTFYKTSGVDQLGHPGTAYDMRFQYDKPLDFSTLPRVVQMVFGDIRQERMIKLLLGDRKLDSASFTFPSPIGFTPCLLWPFPWQFMDGEQQWRSQGVINTTRQATYKLMSERVKPGGTFVLGISGSILEAVEESEIISSDLVAQIVTPHFTDDLLRYWAVERQDVIQVDEPAASPVSFAGGQFIRRRVFVLIKLIRNDVRTPLS